ncbi:peptidase family M49-domain-containing protein [Trichophaea hybrida]|nr:peptidase family M49-domain-containing protein [Trichophaea hybrida]
MPPNLLTTARAMGNTARYINPNVTVRPMKIGVQFDGLNSRQKLYAYHMSRAAWLGARIIFPQVSPESSVIFDLIMELFRSCNGRWDELVRDIHDIPDVGEQLECFRAYAAVFLTNVGNYFGNPLLEHCLDAMLSPLPGNLGFPSDVAQSGYYPGDTRITSEEIKMEKRIHVYEKTCTGESETYEVLLASVETDPKPNPLRTDADVVLIRGDHSEVLQKISDCLADASEFVDNPTQRKYIDEYRQHFISGDLEMHKKSQRTWVKDLKPAVEVAFGFVEPYRDPYGTRAEFEGIVSIVDSEATRELTTLVRDSKKFISTLPWVENQQDRGGGRNGPFEKDLPELPDFTAIHALAYCSSIIFLGVNLPNLTSFSNDDVRQTAGFKNVMIANRNQPWDPNAPWSPRDAPFVDTSEVLTFLQHQYFASYLHITIHELFGHGTGKLLAEESPGRYNFNIENPPTSPLTGKPIQTWYKPGQTWTAVFGNIATSMEECRAECVGSYLITEPALLEIFLHGFIYNDYLGVGVGGLRALENYIVEDKKWGQAHDRGHFAMLRVLLAESDGFMTLDIANIVLVNKTSKPILMQGNLFLEGDVVTFKEYEPTVDGVIQSWAERNV